MKLHSRFKSLHCFTLAPALVLLSVFICAFSFVAWVISIRFATLQTELSASTAATRSLLELSSLRSSSKENLLQYRRTGDTKFVGLLNEIELEKTLQTRRLINEVAQIDPHDELVGAYFEGAEEMRLIGSQLQTAVALKQEKSVDRLFETYSMLHDLNGARLADVHAKLQGRLNRSEANMRSLVRSFPLFLLALMAAVLLLSLFMFRFYRRRVLMPLTLLHNGMAAVSEGRLGEPVVIPPTATEIFEMLEDFNTMTLELKRATDNLNGAREEATRAYNVKSEFLANMSHEIRTPLNVIIGFSSLLSERPLDAEMRGEVETLRRSGQLLLGVVNDILDYSKLESGQVTAAHQPFDVHDVISNIGAMLGALATMKGIELEVQIDPRLPKRILGDGQLFGQVLLNLANNAVKFTAQGRVSLNAQVVHADSGKRLQIAVKDSGVGIAHEKLARLFNRFSQADESITRTHGGTGLGLAIVKQILGLIDGDIEVESTEGRGSTFTVSMPLVSADRIAPLDKPSLSLVQQRPFVGFSRAPKILLADDSADNRSLIKKYLHSFGAHIVEARNGREALEAFDRGLYDVVLMDIQMPELDGYQATREIRMRESKANRKATPVIALTAFALKEEMERSLKAGCQAHLAKPVSKDALLRAIEHFLSGGAGREYAELGK